MTKKNLADVCAAFELDGNLTPFGNGHINDTYLGEHKGLRCVLQRVNTNVFQNPEAVMENIFGVTAHLHKKIKAEGRNADRETLHFLKTVSGENHFISESGDCYRAYLFIEDSRSYEEAEEPEKMYEAARMFGRFQKMLSDFPAENFTKPLKIFITRQSV